MSSASSYLPAGTVSFITLVLICSSGLWIVIPIPSVPPGLTLQRMCQVPEVNPRERPFGLSPTLEWIWAQDVLKADLRTYHSSCHQKGYGTDLLFLLGRGVGNYRYFWMCKVRKKWLELRWCLCQQKWWQHSMGRGLLQYATSLLWSGIVQQERWVSHH